MNKELLRQAFEAGRSWQIAETAEYNGGNENEKPNFNEWYESQVKKLNIPDVIHWVAVEERLPASNGYYICWCKDEIGLIHYHKSTGWQNGFYNERVTHWAVVKPPCA